ncbi:MAG: pantetheine-phosphate adenylyltransferase [Pseudomonadota bacterium]
MATQDSIPRRAVYPGSFDPITNGHVDIIERIQALYDELIVLVANSPDKKYMFSAHERADLIRGALGDLKNVTVDIHDGLTVEYARKHQAPVVVRGLRAVADFEYEMAMANMNKHLNPDVETMIVFADPKYGYVSSRLIKSVSIYTNDLAELVPENVREAIKQKRQNS